MRPVSLKGAGHQRCHLNPAEKHHWCIAEDNKTQDNQRHTRGTPTHTLTCLHYIACVLDHCDGAWRRIWPVITDVLLLSHFFFFCLLKLQRSILSKSLASVSESLSTKAVKTWQPFNRTTDAAVLDLTPLGDRRPQRKRSILPPTQESRSSTAEKEAVCAGKDLMLSKKLLL